MLSLTFIERPRRSEREGAAAGLGKYFLRLDRGLPLRTRPGKKSGSEAEGPGSYGGMRGNMNMREGERERGGI